MPSEEDERTRHHEGSDAAQRFESILGRVLSVSKEELTKRETVYQKTRQRKRRPAKRTK